MLVCIDDTVVDTALPTGYVLMFLISAAVVVAFGLALVGFAVLIVVRPRPAQRFIESFAGSPRAHYTEQVSRLVVGTALVIHGPSMLLSQMFQALGWLMVVTAVALLVLPFRWHHRFGDWVIPRLTKHLKLYALAVFGLGALVLWGHLGVSA